MVLRPSEWKQELQNLRKFQIYWNGPVVAHHSQPIAVYAAS